MIFENEVLTKLCFCVLVKRLGGKVEISQDDIDEVAYSRLEEEGFEDGSFQLTWLKPEKAS